MFAQLDEASCGLHSVYFYAWFPVVFPHSIKHMILRSDLKDLLINSNAQIDVSGNRKTVIIHVPYRLKKAYRKIHFRLVRESEKKFSGKFMMPYWRIGCILLRTSGNGSDTC